MKALPKQLIVVFGKLDRCLFIPHLFIVKYVWINGYLLRRVILRGPSLTDKPPVSLCFYF